MLKILHVLEHSLPRLAGYTIRAKYIIDNQKQRGITPVVITSPLQGKTDRHLKDFDEIDAIRYYRTGEFNRLNMSSSLPVRLLQRYLYSRAYRNAIHWVAKHEQAQIIHSHSSYLNGVRGNQVARMLRVPSLYEVRGLWQDTANVNADITPAHWKYRFIEHMDHRAMLEANKVVTISNQLKNELIQKGIPESRLAVVPNGVDTNIFQPREKNREIMIRYGLDHSIVFGFIGSIRKIEGLALLLENLRNIIRANKKIRVLIVGDGDELPTLKDVCKKNGILEFVTFSGRVNHDQILDYYSVMDILVYPRIDAKVNHKVTPLKPLEAMAMGKVILASDVGGLQELVESGQNGLLFRCGDGDDLVQQCLKLVDNPSLRNQISENARLWTVRNRDWADMIKLYNTLYSELLAQQNEKQRNILTN